jgi:fatty acid desaturase
MDDNVKVLETLFERVAEYGKTSIELVKLKTIDKTADIVSSFIPFSIVILLIATFLLFLNLGLALWLGEVMGKTFYGFFAVAAFYVLTGIVIHFLLHKPIKRFIGNYLIKHCCSKY